MDVKIDQNVCIAIYCKCKFNFLNRMIYITAFLHIQGLSVLTSPLEDILKPEISEKKYPVENRTGLLVLYLCPNNKTYIIF